jgi:hypothetical protein
MDSKYFGIVLAQMVSVKVKSLKSFETILTGMCSVVLGKGKTVFILGRREDVLRVVFGFQ